MTDQNRIEFERMEPREQAAQRSCAACQRQIPDVYYEAAGRIFCAACREAVLASQSGGPGAARIAKALVLGVGAAAVSAVVWYGITELADGRRYGIIALAVGFAVGIAVRAGSEGRGGWAYQAIAVLLTYLAIAASYVPTMLEQDGVGVPLAIAVSLAIPVLQATQGAGIIGFLIVGFALYEAWRINKRQTIALSGPFRLQRAS